MEQELKQKYFEISVRLFHHSELVKKLMLKCAKHTTIDIRELILRAENHDKSKLNDDEYIGTMLLGLKHEYNHDLNEQEQNIVKETIKKHYTINSHHPEHYADCNQMSDLDLLEMVCDWTAMAIEKQHKNTAENFAKEVIGSKYKFDKKQTEKIYNFITLCSL